MSSASWDFCGMRESWASSHGLSAAMMGAEYSRRAARRTGGVLTSHGLFNLIQQRDLAQHLFGDGRSLVLKALHEAALDGTCQRL